MKIPPEKVYPEKKKRLFIYIPGPDASQQEHRHPISTCSRFSMPFISEGRENKRRLESITLRNDLLLITHTENKTPGAPIFDIIATYFPHRRHKQNGMHVANCFADALHFHFSPRRFP